MPVESRFVKVGMEAPDFTLPSVQGTDVSLSDFWGKKHVVLVFIRGFLWPFCRKHLAQLRQDYDKFKDLDAEIVVIAPHTLNDSQRYFKRNQLPFPGLMTTSHRVYDLFDVQIAHRWRQAGFGLFIIDKDGIVQFAYVGSQQWEIPSNKIVLEQLMNMWAGWVFEGWIPIQSLRVRQVWYNGVRRNEASQAGGIRASLEID